MKSEHGAPDLTDLTRPTRHDPTEPQISDTGQPRFFTCKNEWIREWMHGHISTSWSCSFDMLNHFAVVVIQIQCADPFRRRGHAIGPEHVPQHGPRTRPAPFVDGCLKQLFSTHAKIAAPFVDGCLKHPSDLRGATPAHVPQHGPRTTRAVRVCVPGVAVALTLDTPAP